MKTIISAIYIFIFCISLHQSANAQARLDLESGLLFTGYNDVRIPGDQGTFFSLKDDLQASTKVFYRLRASYTVRSRHTISLLYAPLTTQAEGRIARDIFFQGVLFPANSPLTGTYKFNSYRLTYRYDIVQRKRINFGLGFTAKIRDAKISLASAAKFSEKTNVGFVPIINFRLQWKIDDRLGLLLDGDALAAPQGRAEDVLIAATCRLSKKAGIFAGYRILEGGADNGQVYNFALFHYAVFGINYIFTK